MLTLHIGRHKTGTSSIQNFMAENRKALLQQGLVYPEPPLTPRYRAHHDVVLAMKKGEADQLKPWIEKACGQGLDVVISSEGFQETDPPTTAALFGVEKLRIIVYLREHFDYAWSAYAQEVAANIETRHPLDAIEAYRPHYDVFLSKWAAVATSGLQVGLFDSKVDIVKDFAGRIGIEIDQFRAPRFVGKGLGWRAIAFLRQLNERIKDNEDWRRIKMDLWHPMGHLADKFPELREKPVFPAERIEKYQELFRAGDQRVFKQWFGTDAYLFDTSWRGASEWDPQYRLTDEQMDALAQLMPHHRDFHLYPRRQAA